jgi:hypothetical protein
LNHAPSPAPFSTRCRERVTELFIDLACSGFYFTVCFAGGSAGAISLRSDERFFFQDCVLRQPPFFLPPFVLQPTFQVLLTHCTFQCTPANCLQQ